MRVLNYFLWPVAFANPLAPATYDAVPMEVRVPYSVGDCVIAKKLIDYEDLNGQAKQVNKNDKGVLVHVAPDHVVVKWNHQPTLARAAAFPHQVFRATWPKGTIKTITEFREKGQATDDDSNEEFCLTVVEYHGFPPIVKPMKCVELWQNQQFTTPLTCRPGPIYWKKDPSLCVDAVHPELLQLRDCNGMESQIFAMKEGIASGYETEGFMVGTGNTKDLCLRITPAAPTLKDKSFVFGACDKNKDSKLKFTEFDKSE
jgi:hypothetical protein